LQTTFGAYYVRIAFHLANSCDLNETGDVNFVKDDTHIEVRRIES